MSVRIRRPSASTSASTPRGQSSRHRITDDSPRSGSGTPLFDDDEEGHRKRSTRGRNPLPPSSGPLFPPLPPKLPKSRMSGNSFGSMLDPPLETSPTPSEKPDLPTGSNASLTPPPPGSEDVFLEEDEEDVQGNGDGDGEAEVGEVEPEEGAVKLKVEVEEAESEAVKLEERIRNGSERAGSQSRAKRRRGEEALLLDDHLLPPEIRHISQPSSSRRGSNAKGDQEEEKLESGPIADDVHVDDPAVEGEDEIGDVDIDEDQGEDWDEDGGQDITRCVCQTEDPEDSSMMIQCDQCNVWQHGPCMGIWGDDDAPDEYFCELCRPDLHGPLKRWIRRCGRDPAMFVPPTYDDLRKMRPHNDKSAPSQSKLFTDPARMSSPPPAPAKPASRSHHKKEVDPPAGPVPDGRRSGRRLPFPDRPPSKSRETPAPKPPVLPKRRSSVGQVDSVSPNRSLSPSAHMHSAARRRITMNSRDAMYEEEVKAAMEASRREALGLSPAAEVAAEPVEEDQVDKPETKKGKRKRDEEDPNALDVLNGKAKHPNQYTYRPKPLSSSQPALPAAPSPARRGAGGTPAPPSIAPPQHEHGTRRAGAIANGAIAYPNLSATSVANLNWYLPDYLTPYSDLLPTSQPVALDVRSQRVLPHISRNHHLNQRYGPFTEERDEEGRLVLPEEIPIRDPAGEAETHLEPPARIKYPAKRITVGEIRKRVRSMLDYVAKAQGMEEKRLERNRALGIVVTPLPKKAKDDGDDQGETGEEFGDHGSEDAAGESGMDIDGAPNGNTVVDVGNDVPMDSAEPQHDSPTELQADVDPSPPVRTSMELMEELTRDLLAFQDTYMTNNGATPLPPPAQSFEPSLPVPEFPTESEPETGAEEVEGPAQAEKNADKVDNNEQVLEQDDPLAEDSGKVNEPEPTATIEEAVGPVDIPTEIPASSFEIPIPDSTPIAEPSSELDLDSQITLNPTDELEQPKLGQEEVVIEQASVEQTTDVYREGEVDKIIVTGEEERNVVESLEEEVLGVDEIGTGPDTGAAVQVVEPVI